MINNHSKVAFFSIDVERFVDTECVHNTKQKIKTTMLDGLDRYIEILDKYNIKATLFVLSDLAESIYDSLKKHVQNGHFVKNSLIYFMKSLFGNFWDLFIAKSDILNIFIDNKMKLN